MIYSKGHIRAVKKLAKQYETITLKEIEEKWKSERGKRASKVGVRGKIGLRVSNDLIGYGSNSTCGLCLSVNRDCCQCIYGFLSSPGEMIQLDCLRGKSKKTYDAMNKAHTSKSLLKAFRARAKFIRGTMRERGIE